MPWLADITDGLIEKEGEDMSSSSRMRQIEDKEESQGNRERGRRQDTSISAGNCSIWMQVRCRYVNYLISVKYIINNTNLHVLQKNNRLTPEIIHASHLLLQHKKDGEPA